MTFFFEVLLRSLVMFATVYVVFRVFGKRTMAQLTPMDRVSGIAYGTIAGSTSITHTIPLYAGVLAVFAFALLAWVAGRLSVHSSALRDWLMGTPRPLVVAGQLDLRELRRAGLSQEDLWMRLREHKIADLADVELAEIEPDGKLGLLERSKKGTSSKTAKTESDGSDSSSTTSKKTGTSHKNR